MDQVRVRLALHPTLFPNTFHFYDDSDRNGCIRTSILDTDSLTGKISDTIGIVPIEDPFRTQDICVPGNTRTIHHTGYTRWHPLGFERQI